MNPIFLYSEAELSDVELILCFIVSISRVGVGERALVTTGRPV